MSVKNGVTGRARCRCRGSFMWRPEVCLDPSTTGEHMAYIPAVRPVLLSFSYRNSEQVSLFLPQTPAQLATIRVACSYRSETVSPGCLQSASSKLACKAVLWVWACSVQYVWKNNTVRCALVFLTPLLPRSNLPFIPLIQSPPTHPCLFLVIEKLLSFGLI